MSNYRTETDSMGEILVPSDKYWGAQTQRSLVCFSISDDIMPLEIIYSLAKIKKAAALTNSDLGKLSIEKRDLIIDSADEIIAGLHDESFPLHVWQTGSGTQTNMNVNEVISNLCAKKSGKALGDKQPAHPNNDVNMSQSSNDAFSTAMHLVTVENVSKKLLPAVNNLRNGLDLKAIEFANIVKIGRTHLQDAVPITLGQEFSGYVAQLDDAMRFIESSLNLLLELPLGGSAVGTGLNTHPDFAAKSIGYLAKSTGFEFIPAKNKFSRIAAHDSFSALSGTLRTLACALMKIANDIRWLASGPRCGIGEIIIPTNEPGSSIMPGKVNPTQCEAMTMAATQVMGYDAAVGIACSQGNFELNVFKPMIIFNIVKSIRLLTDSSNHFLNYLVKGITPNQSKISEHLENSLMLVTALNEIIGYDKAAEISKKAYHENTTLKKAAITLGYITEQEFDRVMNPCKMV